MQKPHSYKRLGTLVVIALMVTATVCWYIEYHLSRPIGLGPAGPSVDRSAFAAAWSDRKVHVVGLGDSITAGLGAESPSHTFFNRVLENPPDEHSEMQGVCLRAVLPHVTAENLAISGSESKTHLEVVRQSLVKRDDVHCIVMMTSGGNDLIHSYGRSAPRECAMYGASLEQAEPWIEKFRDRLAQMLDEITMKFPTGCEIYIGDIYDPTDGVGDAPSVFLPPWPDGLAIHAKYNAAIREVASLRDHVHVVPLYETFLGHGSHCRQFWRSSYDPEDPHYWFFDNVEDPNDRGYDAIRRVFLKSIVENTRLFERTMPQAQR